MVKVTIKRTDDATNEKNWVCERIDDDMESDAKTETASPECNTFLVVDGNSEDNANWHSTISSCLEIEMKEGDNEEPSCSNSMGNTTDIYTTHFQTFSHEIESNGTSWDDPIDLSTSNLKRESPKNVKNISYKNPNENHISASKWMDYVVTKAFEGCDITGSDRTIQTENAYFPPRPMWSQNAPVAPNSLPVAPNSLPVAPNSLPVAPNSLPVAPNSLPVAPNSLPMALHSRPMALHARPMALHARPMAPQARPMAPQARPMAPQARPMAPQARFMVPNALQMTPNAPPMPIQMPMNYWNTYGIMMNDMRVPYYHFPMNPQGVFPTGNQPTHAGKSEISIQGNIPVHQKQEVQNPLKANDGHSNAKTVDYDLCSQQSYPKLNQSYDLPMEPEGNSCTNQIKQVFTERAGDNSVNKVPQIYTNNRKRSSENCTQIGVKDTCKSVVPPNKKQAHYEVQNVVNYCNVCRKIYSSQKAFHRHLRSNYHKQNVMLAERQRSHLHLNSEDKSCESTNLQVQPQPNEFQPFLNQNRDPIQAAAMTSTNEVERNNVISTNVQNSLPDTSKTNYDEVSSSQFRPLNLERECYSQNHTHINEPVYHIGNLQRFCSNFNNPQLENMTMANPRYLDSKSPQSGWVHKDNSIPIQLEDLTMVNSRNDHLKEEFQTFHCKVCLAFKTNFFQHLQLHIYADRTRTPLDLIIPMNGGLVCKLCDFKTEVSEIMSRHCTSINHVNLVTYYNHVREGGIHRTRNLNLTTFSPIRIFCSACECSIESIATLRIHVLSPDHLYNVSCCMYIASFSTAVEFCVCRLCNLKTFSKRDLLVHARSENHMKNLRNVPFQASYHDPRNMFYIQELNTEKTESPRVSEQNAGNTSIRKEQTHLEKKSDKESNLAQNLASANSGSSSSTSPRSQSISCSLCQQVFPKPDELVQHLYRDHDVTKTGAEWLVSKIQKVESKQHAEKSLEEKIPEDKKAKKVKSVTFWPERCDVNGQNEGSESFESSRAVRPAQGVTVEDNSNRDRTFYSSSAVSSLSQQFNETEHTMNPKRTNTLNSDLSERACLDLSSSENFNEPERLRNTDLDQEKRININFDSNQQFIETESTQSPDKLDNPCPSSYRRNSADLSSNQKIYKIDAIKKKYFHEEMLKTYFGLRQKINEKEHNRNPEKLENTRLSPNKSLLTDASSSEKFKDTEGIQNPDLHQEQPKNIGTASNQPFKEKENLKNQDKLDDPLSNPNKQTCLDLSSNYETEDTRNSDLLKGERVNKNSATRQHFNGTEGKRNPDLYQKSIIVDSTPRQQFYGTKTMLPVEENVSISKKSANFNFSEDEKNIENLSEYYGEDKLEIVIDDSPKDETNKFLSVEKNAWICNSGERQDENKVAKLSELIKNNIYGMETDVSSGDETNNIFVIEEMVPIDDQKLNSSSSQEDTGLHQYDSEPFEKSEEMEMDGSFSDEAKKAYVIEEIVPFADQKPNSNSSQDETLHQYDSEPIENSEDEMETVDCVSDERKYLTSVEENFLIAEERLNCNSSGVRRVFEYDLEPIENNEDDKGIDDFSSDPLSSADTGSLISSSALNTSIESIGSCGSDDIYERLSSAKVSGTERTENNSSPDEQDTWNIKSFSECERNQKVEREVGNYVNDMKTLVEFKAGTNNSNSILGHSVNDQTELTDLPEKTEVYVQALSSPSTTDSQIQARKNIEDIEISNVFSLGYIDISNDTDDGDLDIYSDL